MIHCSIFQPQRSFFECRGTLHQRSTKARRAVSCHDRHGEKAQPLDIAALVMRSTANDVNGDANMGS